MRKECIIIIALITIAITLTSKAQQIYTVNEVTLIVYRDGVVHVKMKLNVSEVTPLIEIPLLTKNPINVIVLDENMTLLDYEINALNMTIYTFSAKKVFVEYDANDLTSKIAGLWKLKIETPFEVNIVLPENSTIIYVNTLPIKISTIDRKLNILMPAGYCEIDYEVAVTPPIDFTLTLIQKAGIVVQGESTSATISVTLTTGTPSRITLSAIGQPKGVEVSFNPSTGIPPFTSVMMIKVSSEVSPGTYIITIIASGRGITKMETYTLTVREFRAPPIIPITMTIGVLVAVVALYLVWKYPMKRFKNLGKLKELTEEEAEIINYIKGKGGRILEAELREIFPNIPRTTLWRMVRRLESKGLVKIRKVGLQNIIELV